MRLEDLFCNHTQPQTKIRRDQLVTEVNNAYFGHLNAESDKYRCDPEALGMV